MNTDTSLIFLIYFLLIVSQADSIRKYSRQDVLNLREEVRAMFHHAYDGYLKYAYPYDELRPLSCDGVDTWGSYSLTLIDALDTLAIMGNYSEFNRVVDIVVGKMNFDSDINVSVFETNIRIVGGLLSSHLLSYKTGMKLEPGWPCNGPLLRLAENVAQRLIAAFDTKTGMPFGTINLRNGVPPGETSVTCTAGIGTFIVEFGTLSRLTGDPLYEEVAMNALNALYHHRSPIGLLGNHLDVMTGRWTAQDAGIGGGVDSYFEYLVKGAILLQRPELMSMFNEQREVVDHYLKKDDWYIWATMQKGQITLPVFQSLEAYWPGVLSLIGDTDTAMRILHNYHSVWRQYGFTPEVYSLSSREASRESYPLRPELIESIMYLYRQTADPILLQMGEDILRSIQHSAWTPCGYATIKDVRDHKKEDRMESFFLAETTKYLYLLFDPDNFIHNPGTEATIINTPDGECVVDVGGYIFNTEAHPIDPAMLHCCHQARQGFNFTEFKRMQEVLKEEDRLKRQNKTKGDIETDVNVNLTSDLSEKVSGMIEGLYVSLNKNEISSKANSNIEIKTETKAEYVNIDGDEITQSKETNDITNMIKKKEMELKNLTSQNKVENKSAHEQATKNKFEDYRKNVVNANIIQIHDKDTQTKKSPLRFLPQPFQDYLLDNKANKRCDPQSFLERIRNEDKYPRPANTSNYELLLTPAPSFLSRISLAGEVLDKRKNKT